MFVTIGGILKRILIYGINYAPEIAGVGRFSGEIGSYLAARGYEVCVLTAPPHYPGWRLQLPFKGWTWTREIIAGVTVYRSPLYLNEDMRGVKRLLAPMTFAISSAPFALYKILTLKPDIVMVVEPTLFVAPVSLLCAKFTGATTVLHVQDLELDAAIAVGHIGMGPMASLARILEGWILRRFNRIITISNRMAEKIIDKGVPSYNVSVVRNWVDLDLVHMESRSENYRTELGIPEDSKVVLYSGNIGAKQGIGLLLEAAKLLAANANIVFVIAGDGPMKQGVLQAAKGQENIRVLDFQPEGRFSEFLGLADVHVLPQERGTADLLLPSKLGGMLASGRPIIVTAERGTELSDFLTGSCELIAPGDSAALASAIVRQFALVPDADKIIERLELAKSLSKSKLINEFVEVLTSGPSVPRSEWRGEFENPN